MRRVYRRGKAFGFYFFTNRNDESQTTERASRQKRHTAISIFLLCNCSNLDFFFSFFFQFRL